MDVDVKLIEAAAAFRDELVPRADDKRHGVYPLWYGWALVEAFQAGAKWQRQRPNDSTVCLTPALEE